MYLILFGLWLVFNGKWTAEIALLGLVVCAAVYWFTCRFIGLSPKKELEYVRNAPKAFSYLWLLIKEIFKANWQVLRLIWSPRLEVEPELHTFHTRLKTDMGKTVLANSITLTPGTITVHVREDLFMVHCLDREMAEGLEDSVFEQRAEELEAKKA